MNTAREWQELRLGSEDSKSLEALLDRYLAQDEKVYENQFFYRFLRVLQDDTTACGDRLLAYRDALKASGDRDNPQLKWPQGIERPSINDFERFGLKIDPSNLVSLNDSSSDYDYLNDIYALEKRRHLDTPFIDPAIERNFNYKVYNGAGQRLAVRLALTEPSNATLSISLPTGCGKTLVAEALTFYTQNELTLVVVPTIALAIDQGRRSKELLVKQKKDHGGLYYWHGNQAKQEHDDIKERIGNKSQIVLYCSPEAVCGSLLSVLFSTAKQNSLRNIVIDEAHIVDQWGTEFRPYFQRMAAVIRTLRTMSSEKGIKCILMSATFTEKSLKLVEELFRTENVAPVYVNGSFLRPEIQYKVEETKLNGHHKRIKDVAISLPKPMIIYTTTREQAKQIEKTLDELGLKRFALFTGDTDAKDREDILKKWAKDDLDIIVATSAFGLGMDKANVRSVVHASVPENLDRFYQEVGRGGRDGRASQSLVVFHKEQFKVARQINTERRITVDKGLLKWKAMWDHREGAYVDVTRIRKDQQNLTDGNEEWNWRTLLLMQRADLIRISIPPPKPPELDSSLSQEDRRKKMDEYYDKYRKKVKVELLGPDTESEAVWNTHTKSRREYEEKEQNKAFDELKDWLVNPKKECLSEVLKAYYKINDQEPEPACGGCPSCVGVWTPTLGRRVSTNRPYYSAQVPCQDVYFKSLEGTQRKRLREWSQWITNKIGTSEIQSICSDKATLDKLKRQLHNQDPTMFWIGSTPEQNDDLGNAYWPQLMIHMGASEFLPTSAKAKQVAMLLAPEELDDENNSHRRWHDTSNNAINVDTWMETHT